MPPTPARQMGLLKDDHIKLARKQLMQTAYLIDVGLIPVLGLARPQPRDWQGVQGDPIAILAPRVRLSLQRGRLGIESRVGTQLAHQMQVQLAHHLAGGVVAEVTIQNQMRHPQALSYQPQCFLCLRLDTQEFGRESHRRFVAVLAALGTTTRLLRRGRFGPLFALLGLPLLLLATRSEERMTTPLFLGLVLLCRTS